MEPRGGGLDREGSERGLLKLRGGPWGCAPHQVKLHVGFLPVGLP